MKPPKTLNPNGVGTFTVPFTIKLANNKDIEGDALLDSGASSCFINKQFVDDHNLPFVKKKNKACVQVVDGRSIESGDITHETKALSVSIKNHCFPIVFNITTLAMYQVIIGLSWLVEYNPHIDWKNRKLELNKQVQSSDEVEKVLDSRIHRRRLEYLVHWKDISECTWESRKYLKNARDKVAEFHEKHPNKSCPALRGTSRSKRCDTTTLPSTS